MVIKINQEGFEREFRRAGCFNHYGKSAIAAIFDHLERMGEEADRDYVLNITGICARYTQHNCASSAAINHGWEPDPRTSAGLQESEALEWLRKRTFVLSHKDGIVIETALLTP